MDVAREERAPIADDIDLTRTVGRFVVTHPPDSVRAGLGEGDAPLHATLWGEPRCGRSLAHLADGTVVRWRRGRWSASGRADVTFGEH